MRSRLQEQGQLRNPEIHYAGVVDCIKKLFQREGLCGFYRGCGTNLLRTTPSAVITFTTYEMLHKFLLGVIPPTEKHSEAHPNSGSMKSQAGNGGNGETNGRISHQSQNISTDNLHSDGKSRPAYS